MNMIIITLTTVKADVPLKGMHVPEHVSILMNKIREGYSTGGLVRSVEKNAMILQNVNIKTSRTAQKINIPLLLGRYSNTTEKYTKESFNQLLFAGPNPTGTMVEYYDKVSYGQLQLEGSAYGWNAVTNTQSYYAGNDNGLSGGGAKFVKDLATTMDAAVDFSQFDNDGPDGIPNSGDDDGYVDVVMTVHTGGGAETGDADNIWSHRWSLQNAGIGTYTSNDSKHGGGYIKINDYIIQPELYGNGDANNPQIKIGIFCHEFGHSLGLPDLYDTKSTATSEGVGNWCLMGSGSYGGDNNHPEKPVHLSAWCKEKLGWVTPVMVTQDQMNKQIINVEQNKEIYKLWTNGVFGLQYFLVENRQKIDFDEYLPGGGLLIWHIDNSRNTNQDETNKLVDLEEADGVNDLDNMINRGDAGDIYPGSSNKKIFDVNSNPNSKDYNNKDSKVSITNIATSNNNIMIADLKIGVTFLDNAFTVFNDGDVILTIKKIYSNQTWLSVDKTSFTVQPMQNQNVIVNVNWNQMQFEQTGEINIVSDDPDPNSDTIVVSVTAKPKLQVFSLTIVSDPSNGGTTDPDGTVNYYALTSHPITAYPNQNWKLSGWGGDTTIDGNNNPINVFMWKNRVVKALFQHVTEVSLNSMQSIPKNYSIFSNYPNPFNPSTTIRYAIPANSNVRLTIFNTLGQRITELVNQQQNAGWYSVEWKANVSSGLYFYRIEATNVYNSNNHFIETKKMMLLR